MYKADSLLLEKYNERVQQPSPLVYITRNKTALSTQRFWEKQLITTTVGTRSSIALRRPKGHFSADMVFTAQVENRTAIIRYAEPRSNIDDMEWTILTTIPNVSELSIMFDGYMVKEGDIVESYTTGDYPYAIYVKSDGSLKALNLDVENSPEITISDLAVNVASVRGLWSSAADLNDGILIFYTNTTGQLWEAQLLDGAISYLSIISMKPAGVTSWVDCWASLTFDYRIQLQLKGNDGKVYTLLSKSRPSGFTVMDYMYCGKIAAEGYCGYQPPVPDRAYNVGVTV